jgi:hypothetical protein
MTEVASDKELKARVDQLILAQGRLDPLELLLAEGWLAYDDYERWRTGRAPDLQGQLQVKPDEAAALLEGAGAYARAQRLAPEPLEHRGWGADDRSLRIGAHSGLTRGCAVAYAPPADRPQLDLFQDSSGLLLEDEIRQALVERRIQTARAALTRLMARDPANRHLRGFLRLIQGADEGELPAPKSRLLDLESIEPVARDLLGHRARDYLAPLWAAFAESLFGRGFDPRAPRLHASFGWARAGHWQRVREAVESETQWRRLPLLVLRHAEACWRTRRLAEARRDWMRLCWEWPRELERAIGAARFPDPRLADLWHQFGDADLELDTEDFPAWLLLEDPGAAAKVPPSSAPPDETGETYRLLYRLVSGEGDIDLRRALYERHPELLELFLGHRA